MERLRPAKAPDPVSQFADPVRRMGIVQDTARLADPETGLNEAVDVVIPTFDARELVLSCVGRFVDEPVVARVIVVDDGSTDGTAGAICDRFADVHVVRLGVHRGLAHAFNAGAAVGNAEYVLFLNNDILALPRAVRCLVEALRENPDAASAGGRLVDPGTLSTQMSYQPRSIPGLWALLVRFTGIERVWSRNPWTGQHLTAPMPDAQRQRTDRQPAGACLMVPRAILEDEGGWDERFWMWYEDVDMSRRLRARGPALYVPDAVFEHIGAASTHEWSKPEQHVRLYHGAMVYAQRHLSRAHQFVLGATIVVACTLRLIAFSMVRDTRAVSSYRLILTGAWAVCRFRSVPEPAFWANRPEGGR